MTNPRRRIEDALARSAYTKLLCLQREAGTIEEIGRALVKALRGGRRVFLFGNGGSAADAQHLAAELEGRYRRERRALPVAALTANTSTLTSVANDYGYERAFSRLVEAHVRRGDAVVAISTSGNSPSVIEGVKRARKAGAVTIGLTGGKGGKLRGAADLCLCVPSEDTPRIQECHITVGHILCDLIESSLFG